MDPNPKEISVSKLQSLQHVEGVNELLEAMRANKPEVELKRILLRHPRLMATFLVSRDKYFSASK